MKRPAAILFVSTFLSGCASAPPPQTPEMTRLGIEQSIAQMRVLLNEHLRWFTTRVVTTADAVIDAEDDLATEAAALRLKTNAVPAMQSAMFQREPVAAMADAWALTSSMTRFFDEGEGREIFGESQPLVVDAFRGLEIEIEALIERVIGTERTDAIRPVIAQFVHDYPIADMTFGRRSAGVNAASVTAATLGTGGLASVAQLDETARDLSDRLTIYAEMIPHAARWQGELLLLESRRDFLDRPIATVDALDQKVGAIVEDVDTLTSFLTSSPDLLAAERALLVDVLQTERAMILSQIDQQRIATLAALNAEREAILAAAEELRRATFAELGAEVESSLDRIDGLSTVTVQEVTRASRQAIDHFFWRALQLLGALVVGLVLVVVVQRLVRPRTA